MKEDARLTEDKIACVVKNLEALKTDIFDGRDIFFDAVLHCGRRMSESEVGYPDKGNVIATDYITPHKGETKSPTPLMMVKVLPGVIFEFRFHLSDSVVKGVTVSAQQKIALFQTLIELFGIGAKTNVGYGVLTSISEDTANQQIAQSEEDVRRAQQRRTVALAPSMMRHAAVNTQQTPSRPAPASVPAQSNEKKPCPGCGFMIQNRFALCTRCRDKARQEGKCAVCGTPTRTYRNSSDHYELCWSCKQTYDPR